MGGSRADRLEQKVEEGRPHREVDPEGETQQEWKVQGMLVGAPVLGSQQGQALCCRVHHEKPWAGRNTAGIKIAGRNINNLRYTDDTTLMAESEEELKRLLRKVKEESEKVGLKLNIQKTKIMASVPITSWEIDGETVETVSDFIWGAPKSLQMVIAAMKLKDAYSLEGKL